MNKLKYWFGIPISVLIVLVIAAVLIVPDKLYSAKLTIKGGQKSSDEGIDTFLDEEAERERARERERERERQDDRRAAKFSDHCYRLNLDNDAILICQGDCRVIDNFDAVHACRGDCNRLDYPLMRACEGNCNSLNPDAAYACNTCGGGRSWTALYILGHTISCY
ncbi:MAG: hypothetical protein LBE27_00625 [Deltaproteobacteria bacterium]|jgi:hypothetical protein|nr:hypothetical protein [Deltaproteobacteria bacterium]